MSSTVSTTVPSRSKTTGSKPALESGTEALQVEVPAGEVGEQLRVEQVVAQRRDGDRAGGDDVEVGVDPLAGGRVLARQVVLARAAPSSPARMT